MRTPAPPEQENLLALAEEAPLDDPQSGVEEARRLCVASPPAAALAWPRARGGLLALAALAVLAVLARTAGPRPAGGRVAAEADITALAESGSCAGWAEDCRSARCCQNGGKDGLQCYARDADWAQCDEACENGTHEFEKAIGYDENGQPKKPTWSCEKLGERSEPGCSAYGEEGCPKFRCEWEDGSCREPCSWFTETCEEHDYCTWSGKECLASCSTFKSSDPCLDDRHSTRCEWKRGGCVQACWAHYTSDDCWRGERCMWNGSCKDDPCSSPGEDCRGTKCCSGVRGGGGMTCYEKDQGYATCTDACDAGDARTEGWSCQALGNRSKTDTHCAWADEECSGVGLCCNEGFECAQRDKYYTGCVQTSDPRSKEKVPLPSGWPAEPKIIGGSTVEYAVQPAAEGQAAGLDMTLYCVMAYLPGSYEERLMEIQRANNAGVFACDAHDLFNTWRSAPAEWDKNVTNVTGRPVTLSNVDVFINVWENVMMVKRLWDYDFTVKVDPDCLIVPQRLKQHLAALHLPRRQPIYVKNSLLNESSGSAAFLGAVEVFSREALEVYDDWYPKCKATIHLEVGNEDVFMKGCMDAVGVGYMTDSLMLKPDVDPAICKNGDYAAYHPLKIQENMQCCIDEVNGRGHSMQWGQCEDLNDGWVRKVWPACDDAGDCRKPFWR